MVWLPYTVKKFDDGRIPVCDAVTFRDATSWLRTYAECCLLRIVTVVSVTANFLLIYCDVYVCLVLNSGSF